MQSISADYSLEHTRLLYALLLRRFVLPFVTTVSDNGPGYQNTEKLKLKIFLK